jgi:integrase
MSGHIRQRSAGSWEIRFRSGTKTHTATVKGTKKAAQARLRAMMAAVDQGTHVKPSKVTVAEQLHARIDHWQASGRISERTAEQYRHLAARIVAGLGELALQQLAIPDVERWHLDLVRQGLALRTIRAIHRLFDRALRDAVRHQLIMRNVVRDQKPPGTEPSAAVVAPNAEQVQALLAKLADDAYWCPRVAVALYCGLRRGEQLSLTWGDIDLDKARLTVSRALDETRASGVTVKTPKTTAGRRTISLPAVVVDTLREHRRRQLERAVLLGLGRPPDDALVFPGDDGGYQAPHAFSVRWARAAARIGLSEITWHALRHAHASMLIAKGVSITTIAARLGHSNPSLTLQVYAHLYDKDDAAAAKAIDQALG